MELLDLLSDQAAKLEGNRKLNLEIDKQINEAKQLIEEQNIINSIHLYYQKVFI